MLSECVEVYATNEAPIQQQNSFNDSYIQTEVGQEWIGNEYDDSAVYASNAPIQQQPFISTQLPQNEEIQAYDDLVKGQFVDEICGQLDEWYDDPCFAQEMQEEMAAIANTKEYSAPTNEMTDFDDTDLFEFFN